MVEVLTDADELGAHESAHGTVLRRQGRGPIKVTVTPKTTTYTAVDWTQTTTVEFSGSTKAAEEGDRVEDIDAFLAGYLQNGFTIERMLEPGAAAEVDDDDVERVLRDRHDMQQALQKAAEHLKKDRASPEVAAFLTERSSEVAKVLAVELDFVASATKVVAALCNADGQRTCDDLEAAVAYLKADEATTSATAIPNSSRTPTTSTHQ